VSWCDALLQNGNFTYDVCLLSCYVVQIMTRKPSGYGKMCVPGSGRQNIHGRCEEQCGIHAAREVYNSSLLSSFLPRLPQKIIFVQWICLTSPCAVLFLKPDHPVSCFCRFWQRLRTRLCLRGSLRFTIEIYSWKLFKKVAYLCRATTCPC
jgi:hypothetical protein